MVSAYSLITVSGGSLDAVAAVRTAWMPEIAVTASWASCCARRG